MVAAHSQQELSLLTRCPVCDRPLYGGAWPGSCLCALHLVQWNGAPERVGIAEAPELLDLVRLLAEQLRPFQPGALVLALADEVLARAAGRLPESLQLFIARRRADLEKEAAKLRGRAEKEARLEGDIQGDIVKALRSVPGLFFWRANAGGAWLGDNFVRGNRSGTSDLICVVRVEKPRASGGKVVFGVFLGLEVKRPGQGQNPNQLDFEQRVRAAGGFYRVARSVAEALQAIEDTRNLREGP